MSENEKNTILIMGDSEVGKTTLINEFKFFATLRNN